MQFRLRTLLGLFCLSAAAMGIATWLDYDSLPSVSVFVLLLMVLSLLLIEVY